MPLTAIFARRSVRPVVAGTGLLALDVVLNGDGLRKSRLWAGGSCGNVLTILAYLGWRSYPIARIGKDAAGRELLRDMKKWGVNPRFIAPESTTHTPVVVERIGETSTGIPWHRFHFSCPNCGSTLPRYRPVTSDIAPAIQRRAPKTQVFYFDRAAPGTLAVAEVFKKKGSIVFFEPSRIRNEEIFVDCLEVSDIVKYSHERLSHARNLLDSVPIPIEIETLGSAGLRYRTQLDRAETSGWKVMSAFPVGSLRDAAGAGDWCSAGIIHRLALDGRATLDSIALSHLEDSLRFGQAIGAIKCHFEGARGIMYSITRRKFEELFRTVWAERGRVEVSEDVVSPASRRIMDRICPHCARVWESGGSFAVSSSSRTPRSDNRSKTNLSKPLKQSEARSPSV